MTLTRDQLRAARILLHLRQDELAGLSKVGVATIRRFEAGQDIGPLYLDVLRRTVEDAGVILLDADAKRGVGVALKVVSKLPAVTLKRLEEANAVPGSDGKGGGGRRGSGDGAEA